MILESVPTRIAVILVYAVLIKSVLAVLVIGRLTPAPRDCGLEGTSAGDAW